MPQLPPALGGSQGSCSHVWLESELPPGRSWLCQGAPAPCAGHRQRCGAPAGGMPRSRNHWTVAFVPLGAGWEGFLGRLPSPESCHGSELPGEAGDSVQCRAAFVPGSCAAVRAAPRRRLLLFLPATGGLVILFCTSTNHQEQY